MLYKGDIVIVTAATEGVYVGKFRKLITYKITEVKGILLGYSFIFEGKIISDKAYWEGSAKLTLQKSHKVWVVEAFDKGNRYLKPIRCLEENMRKVD